MKYLYKLRILYDIYINISDVTAVMLRHYRRFCNQTSNFKAFIRQSLTEQFQANLRMRLDT